MINEPNIQILEKNIVTLNEIARKLGKRSSPLNLIDPQVSRSPWDWGIIKTNGPVPTDHFSRKVTYKSNNLQITLRVNDEYLVVDIKGSFGDSIFCSFVQKCVHWGSLIELASPTICREYECKVFSKPNLLNANSLLQNPLFQQYVKSLHLSQKESLHIGNDYASLYLQRFTSENVLTTLEIFHNLLALLPKSSSSVENFEDVPEEFRTLIPLIRKWAISDDLTREEKINKASTATLIRFVQTMIPYFQAINNYLDSFENTQFPDHALLLSTLAECATEAQLMILKRNAKK